jgi:hypothetical protein
MRLFGPTPPNSTGLRHVTCDSALCTATVAATTAPPSPLLVPDSSAKQRQGLPTARDSKTQSEPTSRPLDYYETICQPSELKRNRARCWMCKTNL